MKTTKIFAAAFIFTVLAAASAQAKDGVADFRTIFLNSERYLVIDEKLIQDKKLDDAKTDKYVSSFQTEEAAKGTSTLETSIADKLRVWLAMQPDKKRKVALAPLTQELAKMISVVAKVKGLTNVYDAGEIIKQGFKKDDLMDITEEVVQYICTYRKKMQQFRLACDSQAAAETTGKTAIQLGAFRCKKGADSTAAAAEKIGIDNVKICKAADKKGNTVWRVRAYAADKTEAKRTISALKKHGIKSFIADKQKH